MAVRFTLVFEEYFVPFSQSGTGSKLIVPLLIGETLVVNEKQQFDKVMAERQDKVVEIARVTAELDKEKASSRALGSRIDDLERKSKEPETRGSGNANSGLVARIMRLEEDLRREREEIARLKRGAVVGSES